MSVPFEAPAKDKTRTITLPPRAGLERAAHILDRPSALAIQAALAANRPLLVRGEPGVGKTQLARAAAKELGRALVSFTVNSRTETDDLLYRTDLVARLAEAQIAGHTGDRSGLELRRFIRPGPLWWAFAWSEAQIQLNYAFEKQDCDPPPAPDEPSAAGVVVLVDEIDKADTAIPNGLLDALGNRGFDVPGVHRVTLAKDAPRPLVIITTNRERVLPDAFVRRCFVLELTLPKTRTALEAALVERGQAHFDLKPGDERLTWLSTAAGLIADDRLQEGAGDRYRAGVAEYIDLLHAVWDAPDPATLLKDLKQFVVDKQGRPR